MNEIKLDEIYEFSSGLSKPASEFGFGNPFLGFKDVFYNSAIPKELNELVNSNEKEIERCSIKRGDVFLTRTSETQNELGMSCVALEDKPNATFNGFTKRLRPKKETIVIPEYARYFFRSKFFRRQINSYSSLSTRASLNNEMLSNFKIILHPKKHQEAIGSILQKLDQKIELNQKMNETLEEIAKTLFKSWFIDFDPIRAKAEGRPTGLSKEISDLFPDSFEDSELGEIPKGWKNLKLGDIAKVTSGKAPPEKEEIKSIACPYLVFGGAGPIGFCSNFLEFTKPAVITGRVGTLGKVFFIDQQCWVSDNSILICDAESHTPIIFQTLKHTNLSLLNVGSTQPLVTGRDIKSINIVGPDKPVLDEYVSLFNNFKIRQNKLIEENEILLKLRDTLLPKLITGELKIPDAENIVKGAGI